MISILGIDKTSPMLNNFVLIMLGIILMLGTVVYVHAQPPMDRAYYTEPVLKDQSGRELFRGGVGEVILIESVLTSGENHNQSFAYIVQIKDSKEITVQLSWMNGVLHPKQELKAGQSWMPPDQGDYSITIFVWESVYNANPLGPAMEKEISVLPESRQLQYDFNISTDPTSVKIKIGENSEFMVIVEPVDEEIHDVKLTIPKTPRGMSVKLEEEHVDNTNRSSRARITASTSIALGTYSFDIVGESQGVYHSATLKVTVVKEDLR